MPKSAKELLEEIEAEEGLKRRGFKKQPCSLCNGLGRIKHSFCWKCGGTGNGGWQGPIMKSSIK